MRAPPPLRLEPRPSRIAGIAVAAGCGATLTLVVLLPLPVPAAVAGAAAIVAAAVRALRRCAGNGVPALLQVGIDRRITVVDRSGRSVEGAIVDDSYVGPALTTIVWRGDGEPWWRPARALLVLRDTLAPDDFRQLRVYLRYGRPAFAAPTSGVDAGRPPSQA